MSSLLKMGLTAAGTAMGGPAGGAIGGMVGTGLEGGGPVEMAQAGISSGAAGAVSPALGGSPTNIPVTMPKLNVGQKFMHGMGFGSNGWQNLANGSNLLTALAGPAPSLPTDIPEPTPTLLDTLRARRLS